MQRQPVHSKELVSIGYAADICVLEVELKNGGVYQFLEVSHEVYMSLMNAYEKYDYYAANIMDNYLVQCVYPPH